jgi:predicted dehydrogenase
MLKLALDGIVIATPSALHARQCILAFERGAAVFCQKPLARSGAETLAVLEAARASDLLLRVDFCYRQTLALQKTREIVRSGEIGTPFAVELLFHNAYGPDKSWARDRELAGGGCLMDLGVHLVDALLWTLEYPALGEGHIGLFQKGAPVDLGVGVEDFAIGSLQIPDGPAVTLACSWGSAFGEAAKIGVQIHGTRGGVAFENVDGSFYDFRCDLYRGSSRTTVVAPPDAWGGRAIVAWANELKESARYRPTPDLLAVANAIDLLYARGDEAASGKRVAMGQTRS